MSSTNLMSQPEFCQATGLTPRQAIYLCEKKVIEAAEDPGGRGRPRRFSLENVAEYRLAQHLMDCGLEIRRVAAITYLVRMFFQRIQLWKKQADFKKLPDSLASVSSDHPIWLVIIDFSAAALRFDAGGGMFTPFIKVSPDGGFSGPFNGFEKTYAAAVTRLEVNLASIAG